MEKDHLEEMQDQAEVTNQEHSPLKDEVQKVKPMQTKTGLMIDSKIDSAFSNVRSLNTQNNLCQDINQLS